MASNTNIENLNQLKNTLYQYLESLGQSQEKTDILFEQKEYDQLYLILANRIIKYKDIESVFNLYKLYLIPNTKYYSKTKALELLEIAAINNHPVAQYLFGLEYDQNGSFKYNPRLKKIWCKRAKINGYNHV